MEEIDLPGFISDRQTLFCGTMLGDVLLQVTPTDVNLLSCATHTVVGSWKPPGDHRVTVATANATQVCPGNGERCASVSAMYAEP